MDKKAILEAVKEVGRLMFFAALSVAVGWAAQKAQLLDPTSTQYVAATLVLRFLDKWVHENQQIEARGVAPF